MLRKFVPLLLGAVIGLLVGWREVRLFEEGSGEIKAIRGAAGAFGAWTPVIVLAADPGAGYRQSFRSGMQSARRMDRADPGRAHG
ncbi:hypothetical protein [Saccharibacillus brassicae]|uniref:Uncharacterized protein n=1 Tax=Saccharibacillus brassicae TaxID=2583377 RepID=A0A4Y6UZ88_SACBS|nr:hypothetical protein [Saccharibacillus brassicae]QDH21736.1 hypothetical protein FFV09_13290 [Saccharibacillus brassicae]